MAADIDDGEASRLYAEDLEGARAMFDAACSACGLELHDHLIGDSGDSLRVALCGPGDAACTLVVLSGLHGIEGHCGSAAQVALVRRLADHDGPVRVILVHGINPGGIRAFRRTNADNVDLNRNYLSDHAALADVGPQARAIGRLFSSRALSRLPDAAWFAVFVASVIARGGMRQVKETLAGGQYFDPQAVFYGGAALAPELQALNAALGPLLAGARPDRTILFDLHSGIGGYKVPSLLANGPSLLPMREIFGMPVSDGHAGDQAVYPARGDVIRGLKTAFGLEGACGVTFELGTGPAARTLLALRAANSALVHFPDDARCVARARAQMLRAFCPQDAAWRGTYVREAGTLLARALHFLTTRADADV